jgi:hypothetical protein
MLRERFRGSLRRRMSVAAMPGVGHGPVAQPGAFAALRAAMINARLLRVGAWPAPALRQTRPNAVCGPTRMTAWNALVIPRLANSRN